MSYPLTPIRCTPQYYYKIWGGNRFTLTDGGGKVGEVWLLSSLKGQETPICGGDYEGASLDALVEIYGDRLLGRGQTVRCGGAFPLLIKLLDAAADLSVQVHPSLQYGGKDEIWYFLATEPNSRICLGLTERMTSDALRLIIERGDLMSHLHWKPVRRGDAIALPAGTIHALGAGTMLIEVQDASDVTYRLYDYDRVDKEGRKRTLHIEESLQSACLKPYSQTSSRLPLVMPRFICNELIASPTASQCLDMSGTSMVILVGISGTITIQDKKESKRWHLLPHEVVLLPAEMLPVTVARGTGSAMMITLTPADI